MMLFILLDAADTVIKAGSPSVPSFGIFDALVQYGAIGTVAIALGVTHWTQLRRMMKTEDALTAKVDALQKEMNDYIRNDQSKMREVIEHNSNAMNELREIILELKYAKDANSKT